MPPIPVYLKTTPDMPRPDDSEFYWLTRTGAFFCRNHPFFASDVPSRRPVRALADHEPGVVVRYPLVKASMLETIVGFFARVYEMHRSEAVVLLVWDSGDLRYRLFVPHQEATVWRTYSGWRSPQDVSYRVPVLPPGQLLVGDIHSHGNMAAFTSHQDAMDEKYRDGIHAVVGRIEDEPPDLHVELAVDGHRFRLEPGQIFAGYERRRRYVPQQWLDRVKVSTHGSMDLFEAWPWSNDRERG